MYGQYGYNGYQMPLSGYNVPYSGQYSQQNVNTLPQQQVLQANGRASIDAIRMAPNSSVLVMDNTAPMVWLCTSDSLGNVTPVAYDITPHKDAPVVDAATLETRINVIENHIQTLTDQMEALSNGSKSNAGSVKPKQAGRTGGTDSTDQTGS